MSHSVSPLRTTCVRGVAVESWPMANVGAIKAPTVAIASLLEREIIVFVIQRSGKVLEVIARGASGALCALRRGSTASVAGAAFGVMIATTAAAAGTAQHDQLTNVDLGAVPGLAVLVLPLPVFDATFDVDLVALLYVLLDDILQLGPLAVPDHTAMPLGLFLAFARRAGPRPAGREPEGRNAIAARRGSDLGVGPEVSDQGHLVQASAHDSSWRVRLYSPRKV